MTDMTRGRIAIAHDYLTQKGGAERVVLALHRMWPDAPIYTTFYDPEGTFPEFKDAHIVTSPLNRVGVLRKDPRRALPLLPLASSLMHVKEPIAVVSTSGWAHGFRYDGATLVYCHTPARWVYLLEDYLGEDGRNSIKGRIARVLRPGLRRWDRAAVRRRSRYVANSTVVKKRIEDVYGLEGVDLVFPPHSVSTDGPQEPIPGAERLAEDGFLLSVARLMPYKHVDVAIEAAARAGRPLVVIGKGPEEARLRAMAGEDVVFGQDLTDAQLRWAYAHATALIAASHEDFGITPLEASAWGVPTVALRAGGYLDTIVEGVNGVFVDAPTVEAVAGGVERLLAHDWDRGAMQAHAERFSEEEFGRRIRALVAELPAGHAHQGRR
ncbi:glycosyltransferase [Micrococcus luteus]|uniref:D-inositol 3-phosphate glycosyltransferase n=1 Tax=Micrococcus luteus TaxID=1270 RepID=A0AAX0VLC5_MICLU|nr:glycosyltransferase [Micrococcus luteus]MCV7580356.1 glycosyltransferase [Micrococcus luteus]MCV7664563.1 glycosyltransferase [Micrococcus luteus]PKZ82591.1 glycosyl transferase family 1 [Micrococcus luteus]